MNNLQGYWFLDGADMWLNFGLAIRKGTADLLAYAPKKDSITHDWPDQNGIDVDLSKVYLKERQVVLQCMILTETEADFWTKHNALIARLVKPGLRRLELKAHGNRSYFVYYVECSNYEQLPTKTLKGIADNMVVHSFNLTLIEPQPQIADSTVFIAANDGAFLIT